MGKEEKDPFVRLNDTAVENFEVSEKNVFEIASEFSERFSLTVSIDSALIDYYSTPSLNRFVENNLMSERSFYFSETNAFFILREAMYGFGLAPTYVVSDKEKAVVLIPLGWGEFFGYLNEKVFVDDVLRDRDPVMITVEKALIVIKLRAKYKYFDLEFIGFDSFDSDILEREIVVKGSSNKIDHILREIARITNGKIVYTGSELILVNRGERE